MEVHLPPVVLRLPEHKQQPSPLSPEQRPQVPAASPRMTGWRLGLGREGNPENEPFVSRDREVSKRPHGLLKAPGLRWTTGLCLNGVGALGCIVLFFFAINVGLHRLIATVGRFFFSSVLRSADDWHRNHRNYFGFVKLTTDFISEISVIGSFGFGPGFFGPVFGPRFFMPTPNQDHLLVCLLPVRQTSSRS